MSDASSADLNADRLSKGESSASASNSSGPSASLEKQPQRRSGRSGVLARPNWIAAHEAGWRSLEFAGRGIVRGIVSLFRGGVRIAGSIVPPLDGGVLPARWRRTEIVGRVLLLAFVLGLALSAVSAGHIDASGRTCRWTYPKPPEIVAHRQTTRGAETVEIARAQPTRGVDVDDGMFGAGVRAVRGVRTALEPCNAVDYVGKLLLLPTLVPAVCLTHTLPVALWNRVLVPGAAWLREAAIVACDYVARFAAAAAQQVDRTITVCLKAAFGAAEWLCETLLLPVASVCWKILIAVLSAIVAVGTAVLHVVFAVLPGVLLIALYVGEACLAAVVNVWAAVVNLGAAIGSFIAVLARASRDGAFFAWESLCALLWRLFLDEFPAAVNPVLHPSSLPVH